MMVTADPLWLPSAKKGRCEGSSSRRRVGANKTVASGPTTHASIQNTSKTSRRKDFEFQRPRTGGASHTASLRFCKGAPNSLACLLTDKHPVDHLLFLVHATAAWITQRLEHIEHELITRSAYGSCDNSITRLPTVIDTDSLRRNLHSWRKQPSMK